MTKIAIANKLDYSQLPKSDRHLVKHKVTFGLEFEMAFPEEELIENLRDYEGALTSRLRDPQYTISEEHLGHSTYGLSLGDWSASLKDENEDDEDDEDDDTEELEEGADTEVATKYEWLFTYLSLLFEKYCPSEKISVMKASYGGADYSGWSFTTDTSVKGGLSVELISPIMTFDTNMEDRVKSIFDFIKASGAETNESTGLHVTVGGKEDTGNFDVLTFAILINDKDILNKFNRVGNTYAKGTLSAILNKAAGSQDIDWPEDAEDNPTLSYEDEGTDNAEAIQQHGNDTAKDLEMYSDRYFSVNLTKKNGTIEYRGMGGDYIRKGLDYITRTIRRICGSFVIANTPDLYEQPKVKDVVRRRILNFLSTETVSHKEWARIARNAIKRTEDPLEAKQIGTSDYLNLRTAISLAGIKHYPLHIHSPAKGDENNTLLIAEFGSSMSRSPAVFEFSLHPGDTTFLLDRIVVRADLKNAIKDSAEVVTFLYRSLKYLSTHKIIPDTNKIEALDKLRATGLITDPTANKLLSMVPDIGGLPSEVTKKTAYEQLEHVKAKYDDPAEYKLKNFNANVQKYAENIARKLPDTTTYWTREEFVARTLSLRSIKTPFISNVAKFITGGLFGGEGSALKAYLLFVCGSDTYKQAIEDLLKNQVQESNAIKHCAEFHNAINKILSSEEVKELVDTIINKGLEKTSPEYSRALQRNGRSAEFLNQMSRIGEHLAEWADVSKPTIIEKYRLYSMEIDPKATPNQVLAIVTKAMNNHSY